MALLKKFTVPATAALTIGALKSLGGPWGIAASLAWSARGCMHHL